MTYRLGTVALLFLAIAGCPQKKHHVDRELGGVVTLDWSTTSAFALAFFETSSGALASSFSAPPLGTCQYATPTPPPPTPTPAAPDYRNAGTHVTLVTGATSIDMPVVGGPAPSYIYYTASPTIGAVLRDVKYDLVISGSADIPARTWSGALQLLDPPAGIGGVALPATGGFDLSWTPAGADFLQIDVFDGFTSVVRCWSKDDGHFHVPDAAAAKIPTGNGSYIQFAAATATEEPLDDTSVVLIGRASTFASYTKP